MFGHFCLDCLADVIANVFLFLFFVLADVIANEVFVADAMPTLLNLLNMSD